MKKGAYGVVYQEVTRNRNLTPAAKGLYAYLAAFCGSEDECYPSVETIVREMDMGKDTFYKHINALVAAGVIEKKQIVDHQGRFGRTIYHLTHKVEISDLPYTKIPYTVTPEAAFTETNNNNINSNNILNNNSNSICSELKAHEPSKGQQNRTEKEHKEEKSGILLPLVDGTDYNVPCSKIKLWSEAYPAVDVRAELKKMIAWLDANPKKKKTSKGIARFITGWLEREQNRGGRFRQQSAPEERQRRQQETKEQREANEKAWHEHLKQREEARKNTVYDEDHPFG